MKKFLTLALSLTLLCVLAVPCFAETMIDRAGAEFQLPDAVDTVISMAPSITETLIDLGCADKIIAVDLNSVGLEGLPENLPAFDMMTPDVEVMASLTPDLVLVSGLSMADGENPFTPMLDLGTSFVQIPTSASIDDIYLDIAFLGEVMGAEDEAAALNAALSEELEAIAAIGASVPEEERPRVYFEISAAPYCYSFGKGVYLDEMLTMVGAENALQEFEGWIPVDPETVVAANPDVIFTSVNYIENPVGEILSRDGWGAVTAVANGDVYYIDNASSSLPNEHIGIALDQMLTALYDEQAE